MADLNDTTTTWEAGVYQIEATDPVVGGAPNPATGAGMSNIPHLQLARRTAFLKKVIDDSGLGAAAVPLVTLNSAQARITGSYRFASGDANTPAAGVAGTLEVIASSASAVNQTAFDSASTRMWTRFWNGTVWSAWSEIWRTTGTAESLASTGWQRLPSGLILQWGTVLQLGAAAGTFYNFSFAMTFPNEVLSLVGSHADELSGANTSSTNVAVASTSQGRVSWSTGGSRAIRYIATGR